MYRERKVKSNNVKSVENILKLITHKHTKQNNVSFVTLYLLHNGSMTLFK